jgi:putative MATE family efflux protein
VGKKIDSSQYLLSLIREHKPMTMGQQLNLTLQLSIPAILAQVSTIVMEYIDASMVGHLGANQSASIGLITSSTWLFGSLCACASTGFSVQVAHLIGAGDYKGARSVVRQSITTVMLFCIVLVAIGITISGALPHWLGGNKDICADSSTYFMIFILALPAITIDMIASGMLRCSGNMKIPSLLNSLMCILDIIFNSLLIFPSSTYNVFGISIYLPGAGLGVKGAALGTAFAEIVIASILLYYLIFKSGELSIAGEKGSFMPRKNVIKKALHIGAPMGLEHFVMSGAQIVSTIIVAPLGVCAIAAHSFAITAESLCYMPGYGISDAATTLVGQCIGAKRQRLTKWFSYMSVGLGMIVMTIMGIIMYIAAPIMMSIMTSNAEIQQLGVMALRIEAFAEPMFAAAIVSYGVFVGAGQTIVPSIMNLASMWVIRLSLAAYLAPRMGLKGVWIAMCIELCFRGVIFLTKLIRENRLK